MGLLTDFFVAAPDELSLLDLSRGPAGVFPTVQAKGFDPLELSTLEAQLTGVGESAVAQPIVAETDEAWVLELGSQFTAVISTMDDAQMERFAEEWMLSEEETAILSDVSALAGSSVAEGRQLYVWISL